MKDNQDNWLGLVEGDNVRVVGGLGPVDKLPLAKIVNLGYAGDNGSPTVIVEYVSCTPDCPGSKGDLCYLQRLASEYKSRGYKSDLPVHHIQEWYPRQLKKVGP